MEINSQYIMIFLIIYFFAKTLYLGHRIKKLEKKTRRYNNLCIEKGIFKEMNKEKKTNNYKLSQAQNQKLNDLVKEIKTDEKN